MSVPHSTRDNGARRRRAIGYLRVSTDLQANGGLGLSVQRDKVREYAAAHDLELVDLVEEAAFGGVREGELFSWEHRPVLRELVARAERREFEVLLVARLDRLSRDFATLVVLERQLARHGVEVISAAEENGDGPIAEYVRGNLALLGQLERGLIRQRLDLGRAKARSMGRHAVGRCPYGYLSADKTDSRGTLRIDPERAPVVKRIFTLARDGDGPSRIARRLNHEGVPGPTGKGWNRQTVTNLVRNTVYAGEMHSVRGAQPAIVSRRLWNAANRAGD
jgi:DNA invertase Pin-like site-specific DNA recombinase